MTLPSTINDAYDEVAPSMPLREDDNRYVDFQEVRGQNDEVNVIVRRIDRTRSSQHTCQLLTGHQGCGKTTELFRIKSKLEQKNFFVVYFDVENFLDINDLDYPEVLLEICEQVEEQLRKISNIELDRELLQRVSDWFARITKVETVTNTHTVTAQGGIGIGFVDILAKLRGEIKNSSQRRDEIRHELERCAAELIANMNSLINDAQVRLSREGKRGLVLLIDGMEKMLYHIDQRTGQSSHTMLFIHHGEQLRTPKCHLIYTYPISLMFDQNIGQIFSQTTILPMIKINQRNGTYNEVGRRLMRQTLSNRFSIDSIFSDTNLIERLIDASGGHLRDFLRLVQYAFDFSDTKVGPTETEKAIKKLTLDYDYLVQPDDLPRLHKIEKEKQVPSDSHNSLLLYKLLVLEYQNGERWADVHPVVKLLEKFKRSRPAIIEIENA